MNPITSEKDKLGFIGIGYMGRPIAQRLLEAGFKLTTYDRDRSKAEQLIRHGGTVAESVAELSSSCRVVLSCLPSDEAVLNTYRGPGGAFAFDRATHSATQDLYARVVKAAGGVLVNAVADKLGSIKDQGQ